MARIVYSPAANADLLGIAEHIAQDNPPAARSWVARLIATCETLATQPEMGELRAGFGVPGCRSFSVGNYVLFYRSKDGGIEVARIVHGSRDLKQL